MIKKVALGFTVLLIAFVGYIAMLPDDFRISRSLVINAPADKIFEQINNPKKMAAWSPWAKVDPEGKFTYSGPQSGVGAVSTWSGNMELGEGSATIIESKPNKLVKTRLDFTKPMQATNTGEFTIKQNGGQAEVTWAMYGKSNFIGKAMGLIFNCEKTVGGMFEQGLENLKTIVEKK